MCFVVVDRNVLGDMFLKFSLGRLIFRRSLGKPRDTLPDKQFIARSFKLKVPPVAYRLRRG